MMNILFVALAILSGSDRYFGIHCDFHAGPADTAVIGSTLKEEDIREICTLLKPDYIQVDTKGHPGWASYPTAIGNAMPRFSQDPMALWRRVTREEGVALYSHYSGVYDVLYATRNPGESIFLASGIRSDKYARTMGPYADDVLIPQLCELAGTYGLDGVWVDGECWAVETDFDPRTLRAFEKETGIDLKGEIPSDKSSAYYQEYREWNRELFRRYVRHYTDSVHTVYPDFKIISNWAFTDHMPEPITANVDYLSGDFSPSDSFFSARIAGRAIEKQGLSWDLMAWGFRRPWLDGTHIPKTAVQLMQEAAAVISLGGGYQIYIPQHRDGSPYMEKLRNLKPVADFMAERKQWTYGGHLKPQVAVLLSTYDSHMSSAKLFSREIGNSINGLVNLLCDTGHSVSIVSEHELAGGNINNYPMLVIPSLLTGLDGKTVEMIVSYVRDGGSVMLTGAVTCRLFAEAGLPCAVTDADEGYRLFGTDFTPIGKLDKMAGILPGEGEIIATMQKTGLAAAAIRHYGKGTVGIIPADLSSTHMNAGQWQVVKLAGRMIDKLYTPEVKIESVNGNADIAYLVKDGHTLIQLTNSGGQHHSGNYLTEESIAPAADIVVKLRQKTKPSALILQPEGRKLKFTWDGSTATVYVPRVDIHSIIEVK